MYPGQHPGASQPRPLRSYLNFSQCPQSMQLCTWVLAFEIHSTFLLPHLGQCIFYHFTFHSPG
jgi:hypothetical protein